MERLRNKKGLLFTLYIFLVASAFLNLTISISLYSNSLTSILIPLSTFERINAQFDSASYGLKTILSNEAFNFTYTGNNLSLFLNTSKYANYQGDVSAFKQFIEAYGTVNTAIDATDAIRPRLYIQPQNIVIDSIRGYSNGTISITPQNTSSSTGQVYGYDILVIAQADTPSLNWSSISELSEGDLNSIYFHIGFQGTNGTCSVTKYLDKHASSGLQLLNSYNRSMMTIRISSPASILIEYNLDMYLNIIIKLNSTSYIEMGTNVINVSSGVNGEKVGSVIMDAS